MVADVLGIELGFFFAGPIDIGQVLGMEPAAPGQIPASPPGIEALAAIVLGDEQGVLRCARDRQETRRKL